MQRAERRGFVGRLAVRAADPPRRSRRGLLGMRRRADAAPLTAGRDVSAQPERPRRIPARQVAVVVAGAVCAALLLVVLRIDSIRLRYRLADAMRAEQQLQEQQRRLIVDVRRLRHPLRLAELGRELGLARPERVFELGAAERTP